MKIFILFVSSCFIISGVLSECCPKKPVTCKEPAKDNDCQIFIEDQFNFFRRGRVIRVCEDFKEYPGRGHCGKGKCNLFGCNCDGGCIEPKESYKIIES